MSSYNVNWYPYEATIQDKGITFNIYPVAKRSLDNTYKSKQESNSWAPLYDRKQDNEMMEAMVSEYLNEYIW